MEASVSNSQVIVTAEVFTQRLKQKYPQRAAALGDHLISAFVKDHPQYRVTYDGNKAVSVSWHRTPASTTTASSTQATVSTLAPGLRVGAIGTQSEQRLKSVELSPETCSGRARDLHINHDDSGSESHTVNKRKHLRVPYRGTRAYIISDNVPGVFVDVVEISRGGLRFVSIERFDQQAAVSVAIHYIAGGQNIFQDGLIVRAWHERTGMLPNEYAAKFSL
jgi:hypothetical protein